MHKYLLAAVAAAAIASPAAARDGAAYVGVEGGLVFANHEDFDFDIGFPATYDDGTATPAPGGTTRSYGDNDVHFRPGVDMDAVAGYDFGMFRLEGELAWKSVHTKGFDYNSALVADVETFVEDAYGLDPLSFEDELGTDVDHFLGIDDHATVMSLMVNGLLDFETGGLGLYGGLGAGRAKVKMFNDSDSAWAWQGILGARMPISDRVDFGLKYRYFRTGRVSFTDTLANPVNYTGDTGQVYDFGARGRLSTHSILASLLFNLGSVEAPVEAAPVVETPAPEPAPATQTCPDGTVILATDQCPPPPPPPAQPSGERG